MVYKKEIHGSEKVKDMEYVISNNSGIYINSTVTGMPSSPSHGLFIKQNQSSADEVYVAGVIENIDFGSDMDTTSLLPKVIYRDLNAYFDRFEFKQTPVSDYVIGDIEVTKKYLLSYEDNTLCIFYDIKNNSKKNCRLKVEPLLTKRDLFSARRMDSLKFTNTIVESGVKINLSILDKVDIYIKSNNMKYTKKERFLNGVIYTQNSCSKTKKTLIDDLYIPGNFEYSVKANSNLSAEIYISLDNIDLLKFDLNGKSVYSPSTLENKHLDKYKRDTVNILEEYHELKALSRAASNLKYIDSQKKNMVILDSVPKQKTTSLKDGAKGITDKISSIDGNYLSLGRYVEAGKILTAMKKKLEEMSAAENAKDNICLCEDTLSFIEAINRYIQAVEYDSLTVNDWYEYIGEKMEQIIDHKCSYVLMDTDFLLVTGGEKNIKINSLWYNAIKIYEDLERKFNTDAINKSNYIYDIGENVKKNIEKTFWDENVKVLKQVASGDSFATIEMIYALGLSYIAVSESLAIRLVDTAFKELYTPYGMRLASRTSSLYDGYVYPKYMTYFVKANLRQTGITRASQKLAYNLVKDLLGEINKYTIGSIKEKYFEQNKKAYGPAIDSLTNAEMIRLYKMFV